MSGLNFPTNPSVGDTWTIGTRSWVWNGVAWQLQTGILSTNPFTVISEIITTTTNSTSTTSGALVVGGGAGFAGDIHANTIYANNAVVLTTATIGAVSGVVFGIIAGTDTSVSSSTGAVTIWNTSTLDSVTSRGSVTHSIISILNTASSTATNSGALVVAGGVGISGDLHLGGNLYSNGQSVLTTSSLVTYFTGGTDISIISTGTSTVIQINDISTLQSVTSRGSSSTSAIILKNINASTSTNTGALTVAGGVGIGGSLYLGGSLTVTRQVCDPAPSAVNTSTITLDSFSTSTYRSAKYFISVSNPTLSVYQTSEIWLIHDGSSAQIEETSVYSSGMNLVTFDAIISSGTVSLTVIGSTTGTNIKVQGTYITV